MGDRERDTEREREGVCMCMCVYVCNKGITCEGVQCIDVCMHACIYMSVYCNYHENAKFWFWFYCFLFSFTKVATTRQNVNVVTKPLECKAFSPTSMLLACVGVRHTLLCHERPPSSHNITIKVVSKDYCIKLFTSSLKIKTCDVNRLIRRPF